MNACMLLTLYRVDLNIIDQINAIQMYTVHTCSYDIKPLYSGYHPDVYYDVNSIPDFIWNDSGFFTK